ncbi:MAG: Hsp20/alpha crystallin family protein [Acidobacteria bacterium]|nr:MAG: Hsp20/alpha crystallin family protein [Acidobacteriota bacterium]
MAIVRFNPFRELLELQDRMNRILEDNARTTRGGEEGDFASGSWIPPVDIYESADALLVKAELPEVSREDIDIRLENGVLTIRGERKLQEELKKHNCYRMESQYGAFSRSFSLPRTVDSEKIEANYKDGVLNIRIPKREETKPRQIQIK